jgi:hypothetical protein
MHDEYSSFYFLDSKGKTIYRKTTKFNKKGDGFHHSIFVSSEMFDFFSESKSEEDIEKRINKSVYRKIFNSLEDRLNKFLKEKRKPLLKENADKLVETYDNDGILPEFVTNPWDIVREKELKILITNLYMVEPKIFTKLNVVQKKIFTRFLYLLMDNESRNDLFPILEEIIELDDDERKRISEILKVTKLSSILETIELIRDRIAIVDNLKQLVFNKELKANEVDHLQEFIEDHFWIFGEEFRLVAAAEVKFDNALKNFREAISQKYDANHKIEHDSRLREMDIFLVRQNKTSKSIDNLVVELKHPTIIIGKKELDQVREYMRVILSEELFNANSYSWEFQLIGKSYNSYIEEEIDSLSSYGEKDLVFRNPKKNYKIYVRKWSDVINDIEIRHQFLDERLSLEREKIYKEHNSIEDLLEDSRNNTAKKPL